jgi:hypothetical protein
MFDCVFLLDLSFKFGDYGNGYFLNNQLWIIAKINQNLIVRKFYIKKPTDG